MMSDQNRREAEKITDDSDSQQTAIIIGAVIVVLIIAGLIAGAILLALNADTTGPGIEVIRDLLVILMAFELLVVGTALTVLVIQIARFVNLLNNEINPVIESAQETLQTVKGTATFLSNHLVEPVMQANSTLKGISRVLQDVDAIKSVTGIVNSTIQTPASPPIPDDQAEPQAKTE